MRWMRFRIRTNEESEDIIVSSMQDIGLYGAQIEDNAPLSAADMEQMFVDDLPTGENDDGSAVVSFFVEADDDNMLLLDLPSEVSDDDACIEEADETGVDNSYTFQSNAHAVKISADGMRTRIEEVLNDLRNYTDLGEGTISVDMTEDIDWMNNWKQFFHKFYVDDTLIIPSWEEMTAEDQEKAKTVLHIDPGTAFGTGMHDTTQLCIRQLKKYIKDGDTMLDIGTGSGVLAIAALKFGAERAIGTDLDPNSEIAAKENVSENGIDASKLEVIIGNIIDDQDVQARVGTGEMDVIVANILPVVLLPLTPMIPSLLKDGGIYITSGIINEKEEIVKKAHEDAGLKILEIHHQGEWVSITSQKV